jgi:hypothetical protein
MCGMLLRGRLDVRVLAPRGSEKVVWLLLCGRPAAVIRGSGGEDDKLVFKMLINLHDGSNIAAAVAVIGRRPHSAHCLVKVPLVSLHHKLVRSQDLRQPICPVELCVCVCVCVCVCNVCEEREGLTCATTSEPKR